MRQKSISRRLIISVIGLLLIQLFPVAEESASAQARRRGSRRSSVSSAQPSLSWDRPASRPVPRKPKPRRAVRPRGTTVRRPPPPRRPPSPTLLALQWRVLKLDETTNESRETNPAAVFHFGDRLRIGVTANQEGYLYIIHQRAPGMEGRVLFPDSRLNNGDNFVNKNEEFILPPEACPLPDPRACWYLVEPPSGREVFTIIFSRDSITGLPDLVAEVGRGAITQQVLNELLNTSPVRSYRRTSRPRNAPAGLPGGAYAQWVVNTSTVDNEEIILTIPLDKGQ